MRLGAEIVFPLLSLWIYIGENCVKVVITLLLGANLTGSLAARRERGGEARVQFDSRLRETLNHIGKINLHGGGT